MEKVRKILVPIDFSAESGKALRDALRLARETKAQLVALHVIDKSAERELLLSSLAAAGAWPFQPYGSTLQAVDILLRERRLDLWNFVAQEAGAVNQDKIIKVIKIGRLAHEMACFIRDESIDLLVLKLRKRFFFPDLAMFRLLKIARRLACPVLLDPPALRSGNEPGSGLWAFDLITRKWASDPVG